MSNTYLLQVGDVIYLPSGTQIFTEIPEMFVSANRGGSKKIVMRDIIISKTYIQKDPHKEINNLVKGIKNEFTAWGGFDIETSVISNFVSNIIEKFVCDDKFILEAGEFIVTKTVEEYKQIFRDGSGVYAYHVFAKKLTNQKYDAKGIEVNFYQTGPYLRNVENVKPIRKMEKYFKEA